VKLIEWSKKNLFNSYINSFISVLIIYFFFKMIIPLIDWLVIESVWLGSADVCRSSSGACLAFIREKYLYILFGHYPYELLWRPWLMVISFILMIFLSRKIENWNMSLAYKWLIYFVFSALLLSGGIFGLDYVPTTKWGGLPLTLVLSILGIVSSYPMGIFLALGRRSNMPIVRFLCIGYIELIRGVPLISFLFMSSVLFPLFLPEGVSFPKLLRAQMAIIFFSAAYMAEVIRGGLQAIPKGQYEAADALGLSYYSKMRKIILPQALKIVIPPTVNTAIGIFKDTSLVIIIALFDLMNTTKSSLTDPLWLGFSREAYLFVALIYFFFCFTMSRYSKKLETSLIKKQQR